MQGSGDNSLFAGTAARVAPGIGAAVLTRSDVPQAIAPPAIAPQAIDGAGESAAAAPSPDYRLRLVSRDAALRWLSDIAGAAPDGAPNVAPSAFADANPFASPWFMAPSLDRLAPDDLRVALVERLDGGTAEEVTESRAGTLIAIVPLRLEQRLGRVPVSHWAVWRHPNAFLAPLWTAAGMEQAAWRTILCGLADHAPASCLLHIDGMAADAIATTALAAAAQSLALPMAEDMRWRRAMLTVPNDAAAHWDGAVRAKKRKELRRQWARLAELGAVRCAHAATPADVATAIDAFIALELAGWKGAQGSALGSDDATRAFFTSMCTHANSAGALAVLTLMLDGKPIAMLVTLHDGANGFTYKTAYDESYARFSPGVLLQREAMAHFAGLGLRFVDSCAASDHPMIDSLWPERRDIVALSVALPGRANTIRFDAMQAATRGWRHLKRLINPKEPR